MNCISTSQDVVCHMNGISIIWHRTQGFHHAMACLTIGGILVSAWVYPEEVRK